MKKLFLILMIFLGTFSSRADRVKLINSASQITVNNIKDGDNVNNLIDDNVATSVHSKEGELTDNCYIQVNLGSALSLTDQEDLIVYLQRCDHNENEVHPTTFKVEGSEDGTNWSDVWDNGINSCQIYFLYRGPKTKEYSTRIRTSKPFQYLRFTVMANSGRKHDTAGHRYMGLSEFQIYKLGRNDNYSDNLIDRFHLTTDYYKKLANYEFKNTQGILDSRNRNPELNLRSDAITSWCVWDKDWKDGKWQQDRDSLEAAGLSMPDYTMLTAANDTVYGYHPDAGEERQPTHIIEHILYAIPGDAVALYPYYRFTSYKNYQVKFTHWYDYQSGGLLNTKDKTTGKETSMLDFLIDPSAIHKNEKYGYFAGEQIGKEAPAIYTVDEYIKAVEATNMPGGEKMIIKLGADLDFTGYENVPQICTNSYFRGTLDGNGHRISNLKMKGKNKVGLIATAGNLENGSAIKNLIIDGTCEFTGEDKVAALVGEEIWGNGITIEKVQCYATVTATNGQAAALIASKGDDYNSNTKILNCFVGGSVSGKQAAAIVVWKRNWNPPAETKLAISNTVSNAKVNDQKTSLSEPFYNYSDEATETSNEISRITNCYYNATLPDDLNADDFIEKLGTANWKKGEEGHAVPIIVADAFEPADSKYGKIATFFCPRSPYDEGGTLQSLPFREGEDEFIIAADFSQSFSHNYNLQDNTIIEPVIQFRHIFRIRDGKTFAESFSGSVENNLDYIKKNLRRVSARANVPFQIRLDSPIPRKGTTRSKYYYKISDQDYRRVCTMNIEVSDLDTGNTLQKVTINSNGDMVDEHGETIYHEIQKTNDEGELLYLKDTYDEQGNHTGMEETTEVTDKKVMITVIRHPEHFYYGAEFDGEGSRIIDGITYNICGGGGKYYRMLQCDSPKEGRYLVRITGNDINGTPIHIVGTETPLIVMEMELTVLPETAACMVSDKDLYAENTQYSYAQEEELEKAYGAPQQRQNFDQYTVLETLENKDKYLLASSINASQEKSYKLKWPLPWNDENYAFDYNETRDYNMYLVTKHSSQTPYNAAVKDFTNTDGTKGLYDRLYYKTTQLNNNDHTTPIQRGYFYYVNASDDPGVMAYLRLDELCMGSTIHVSAWIAEFSTSEEVANVSFNFVAVLKDKERRLLHSFVSGYIPDEKRGEWMNIYYSFVPNYSEAGITPDEIDHYELELENNCKSSAGADYAVDNIRLYVASPQVYATQNEPICDKDVNEVGVRIESPFDVLLQVVGETETKKEDTRLMNLYYTFLDKQKFDEEYAKSNNGETAYNASVLKYNYSGTEDGSEEQTFGKVSFNLNFTSNPEYENSNHEVSETAYRDTDDGTRLIVFNTRPKDNTQLSSGKEYYVSIYAAMEGDGSIQTPGWSEFNIKDPCAKVCVFRVKPASMIKIDGEVRQDIDNITCCENQSPVVQVNLYGKNNDGTISDEPIMKNARMDWYNGSYDEYQSASKDDILLSDALAYFRLVYPDAETLDNTVEAKGDLTDAMITYLKELSEPIPEGELHPKLSLSQTSYVFPPAQIPYGQTYSDCRVVAIPIDPQEESVRLCTVPTEVRIRVQQVSPTLSHGIAKIDYPDYMDDVPLRIGLNQLITVSAASDLNSGVKLNIPVRKVRSAFSDTENPSIQTISDNPYIYLVETNDPDYSDLGTVDQRTRADIGTLKAIGEISGLSTDRFNVVFYNDFIFKEGYYYRMRFSFEEEGQASGTPDEDAPLICNGHDVFTIKVVPEYQRWTGNTNKNWNNDTNWTRVSSNELYLTDSRKTELNRFVTDGVNTRAQSYAPLDFTKVIMPGETANDVPYDIPYLNEYTGEAIEDFSSDYSGSKVIWTKAPSFLIAGINQEATTDIQYDMAAYNTLQGETITSVNCRPWYSNTCEQIHFRPNSEIMGQQNLIYQKAWVDMATVPGRWYTLSTPLKTVYAGDLYLPSDNGRQETELFQEMTFNKNVNNRFNPAVYQRGWNKSNATLYEIPNEQNNPNSINRNVAIKANWSSVYNDVAEAYGGGTGFSIKTIKSTVDEVLFRLPKSDESFNYYSADGNTVGNTTLIKRSDNFRLNDVSGTITSVSAGNGNRYFLVGNPFMAHLNMKKFLETNQNKINQKYWLLTEGSQSVAVFDENSDGFVGSASGVVAPMQGFFVEAANGVTGDVTNLELTYDVSMACTAPFTESSLRAQTRSGSAGDNNAVVISALRDNRTVSQAFIHLSQDADCGYNEKEDALLFDNSQLDIPAEVYTVAGNAALSVNSTDDADGTEIGLLAEDAKETVLVFEGVDPLGDLALYDASTGYRTALYEGMEYPVTGPVAGRLYITSGKATANEEISSMRVSVYNRTVRIEAGSGNTLSAKAYTMQGFMIKDMKGESPILEFKLNRGIYILEATNGIETTKRKILIL